MLKTTEREGDLTEPSVAIGDSLLATTKETGPTRDCEERIWNSTVGKVIVRAMNSPNALGDRASLSGNKKDKTNNNHQFKKKKNRMNWREWEISLNSKPIQNKKLTPNGYSFVFIPHCVFPLNFLNMHSEENITTIKNSQNLSKTLNLVIHLIGKKQKTKNNV